MAQLSSVEGHAVHRHIKDEFSGIPYENITVNLQELLGDPERMSAILLDRRHGWSADKPDLGEWITAPKDAALHEHAKPEFFLAVMEDMMMKAAGYPYINLTSPPRPKTRVIKSKGPGEL